jgi:hypothetical protein
MWFWGENTDIQTITPPSSECQCPKWKPQQWREPCYSYHNSCRMQPGCFKASHRAATPLSSRKFDPRSRRDRDLLHKRAWEKYSQATEERQQYDNLQTNTHNQLMSASVVTFSWSLMQKSFNLFFALSQH